MPKFKFYLLWHSVTNRMVIDRTKLKDYEVQKKTDALCWIEAKKNFGFELTPLQQEKLNAKSNSYQAGRRLLRDIKDAGAELWSTDGSVQDGVEIGEDAGNCVQ